MRRVPTDKQFRKLAVLGYGLVALAPSRGDWGAILKHGWVKCVSEDDGSRYLPPLEITPDGLRAVADYLERNPQPDWTEREKKPPQVNEPPSITRLKEELANVKKDRDHHSRDAHHCRMRLRRVARECEGLDA